jgi:hypothetical protein
MTNPSRIVASLASLTLAIACESPRSGAEKALAPHLGGIQAMSFANSERSAPVNVGAPINSAASETNATLSPDNLSLYFTSNRAGGLGGDDVWVSQRDCDDCPWGAPVNLGAPINSASAEGAPNLSADGHLLFFFSGRPDGQGGNDVYVSRRSDPKDDLGWGPAVGLGPDVNTAANEAGGDYQQNAEDGTANFYFNRTDIYYASVTRDGETTGPAVLVAELSDPAAGDLHASVRTDGKEVFLHSNRVGGLGGNDIWTSTRRNIREPWSTPVDLGAPWNTTVNENQPSLSNDGRTLLFSSNRPGGLGGNDLWISTRTPSGKEVP